MNRQLFELQETDNKIIALKRERSHLDDGASTRAQSGTLTAAIETEAAELVGLNSQRSVKEDELKAIEEKIAKQQGRLMTAKNAHEVTSLQRDIDGLTRARGDSDEAVLMLMDEAESCANRLQDLTDQKKNKDTELARIEENFASQTSRIEAALGEATTLRAQIAAKLDEDETEKYEDYAKRFHGVAIASGEGGNCSACGTTLTPFSLKEAKKQEWPTCESCGRLLWVEP